MLIENRRRNKGFEFSLARMKQPCSPLRERGARDLIPLLLWEKGLGDEGARDVQNACLISFELKLTNDN
ncbi:hypothetical protein A6S26_14305 [Nostoc sp. ATCC 43529]|nr:hypothetical protein A6S26_14305 [Nostoc sp. ATCC 43529]